MQRCLCGEETGRDGGALAGKQSYPLLPLAPFMSARTRPRHRTQPHFPAQRLVADKCRGFPPLTPAVRSPRARETRTLTKGSRPWFSWQPAAVGKPLAEVAGVADYGEVLEWACARPGCCEVRYERGGVALQAAGSVAAQIVPVGTALSGERMSPR